MNEKPGGSLDVLAEEEVQVVEFGECSLFGRIEFVPCAAIAKTLKRRAEVPEDRVTPSDGIIDRQLVENPHGCHDAPSAR
ncbi:hypothetical protein [Cellulomonas sp. A375-1]|uniref:hypothetical protein n=1 Tax=Cellulomonas sp. A375-1 TaxID=1672219 RepID=UPI0012E2D68E|nr:hypothetical protein [Cellulomonas sp. A375-1]